MKQKNSYLPELLIQLCTTLAECKRVINKGGSYAARRAEAIIAAVEPQAIACLDEELCNVPKVKQAVFSSLSIPLITHLRAIARTATTLDGEDWSMLALNGTPAQIEALLGLGLRPEGGLYPLLTSLIKRDSQEMRDLIHTKISPHCILDGETVRAMIDFRGKGLSQDIARILQDHARLHPATMTRHAQTLFERPTPYYTIFLILAGVSPSDLRATGVNQISYSSFLLSSLQNNHGLLALKRHCPDLAAALEDRDGYLAYESSVAKSYRAQSTPVANSA